MMYSVLNLNITVRLNMEYIKIEKSPRFAYI